MTNDQINPADDPALRPAFALVRAALQRAGYTEDILAITGPAGMDGWSTRMREALPRLESDAVRCAVCFFLLRDPMSDMDVDGGLGTGVAEALLSTRLADGAGGGMRSTVTLAPCRGLFIASDPLEDPVGALADDQVLPAGNATRLVDDLAVRAPGCGVSVDVGCGQGYLSLRAAAHARESLGTDIAPRALGFARLNSAINGVESVAWRQGSYFEPLEDVRGRVDLLTCNPPFVMAPGSTMALTGAGEGAGAGSGEGDSAVEHVLRTTPLMLGEGGWASITGQWHHEDPKEWSARVRGWLAHCRCDALILKMQTLTPQEYFRAWGTLGGGDSRGWHDLCVRRRIGAVTHGAIVLHKRSGPTWMRTMGMPMTGCFGPASDQLQQYFASQTRVAALAKPSDVLDLPARAAADVTYRANPRAAAGQPAGQLAHARGIPMAIACGEKVGTILVHFDGVRPARAALAAAAGAGAQVPTDGPEAVRLVHAFVGSGILELE